MSDDGVARNQPVDSSDVLSPRRCHLTLLFADLCDSTGLSEVLEAEHYASVLGQLRSLYQSVVPRHGGLLLRIQGDGMLAVFGYPQAEEDCGRRATEAALELHGAVHALRTASAVSDSLALHCGIHAGMVLVEPGDAMRGRFDLLGNVPNIAARLCAEAGPDEVLVSAGTLGTQRRFFRVEADVSLMLKGRREPLVALRVRVPVPETPSARPASIEPRQGLAPFIGRRAELQFLDEQLDLVLAGQSICVALCADAGLGKSRLMDETLKRAAARGAQVHRGDCESYLGAEPLQPFLQVLRSLFGLQPGMSADQAAQAIDILLAGVDGALASWCDEFLRLLSWTCPGAAKADGLHREAETPLAALSALFTSLARRRPQVLALDDWQWADDASAQALHAIQAQQGGGLLVLLATRELKATEAHATGAQAVLVSPLDDGEAEQTIRRLLPQADPFVAAEIRRYAGGNPLFIEELCHNARLTDGRARRPTPLGRAHAAGAWMDALIGSRVACLDDEQRRLLNTAAVIGSTVPVWLLSEVGACTDDDPVLQSLAGKDLLYPSERPGVLRFKHGITRDVIYESVGLHERQALHRRIALALHRRGLAGEQEEAYEALAYHYRAGNQPQEAAHYAELAGDKAVAASALDRAKRQYRAALDALDQLPTSVEVVQRWVAIAQRLGLACVFDASRDELAVFRRGVVLADGVGDLATMARARYWLGYVSYALGDARAAVGQCEEALRLLERVNDPPLAVQVHATLGQARAASADYPGALALLDEAIEVKRRHRSGRRPAVGLAYSLACAGYVLGDLGRFVEAHARFDEALAAVDGGLHHEVGASIRGWQAAVHLWQGHWEEAHRIAAQAYRIGEQVRSLFSFAMSRAAGAYGHWMLEGTPEALQTLQEATLWLAARQGGLFHSLNHGWLSDALGQAGDRQGMRRHAACALVRQRQHDLIGSAMAWRALARDGSVRGDTERAVHCLSQAQRVAEARGSAHERAVNHLAAAQIALRAGRTTAARPALNAALTAFDTLAMPWHLEQAMLVSREL